MAEQSGTLAAAVSKSAVCASVPASASGIGAHGHALGAAGARPVAGLQACEAGIQVEGEPARELRMPGVPPPPERAAPGCEEVHQLCHPRLVRRNAAAAGEIEQECEVEGGVEGERPAGPLEPEEPSHLVAEAPLVARLPRQEGVAGMSGAGRDVVSA